MRARLLRAVPAAVLALCLFAALPALASGEDSLVTESRLDDWAEEFMYNSLRGMDSALAEAQSSGADGRTVVLSDGDTLMLDPGASAVLVSGSARMNVRGDVINVTVGGRAVTGGVNSRQLYIVGADSSADIIASGSARAVVWGGADVRERSLVFTDVPEYEWYWEYVYAAVDAGLVDGVTETTFEPDSGFTVAQAIKIAACLHELRHTGEITLANGETWYEPYVEYAVENGIAGAEYASMGWSGMNAAIDRRDFAVMFYRAMPERELAAINTVTDIPDVPAGSEGAEAIYALYRAGVLDGAGEDGSYMPDSGIRRSEVSAIVARLIDKNLRVSVSM